MIIFDMLSMDNQSLIGVRSTGSGIKFLNCMSIVSMYVFARVLRPACKAHCLYREIEEAAGDTSSSVFSVKSCFV